MRWTMEEAYRRYADHVFAAAFSVCQNPCDAEDVVQDTFLKYGGSMGEFKDEDHLRAWLLRVAINRAKDLCRSFWHSHKVAWEEYMEEAPFAEPQDGLLFEAVMRLPEKYRTVIHLFYYEDYSVAEIAQILGRGEGTVKSQLSRGRSLLKKALAEEWNDDE